MQQVPHPEAPIQAHELFEILVREHEAKLRAYLTTMVRDPGALDDLVQESFLVAWRRLEDYDHKLPFGPWVRGIGRRLSLAHHRRQRSARLAFVGDEIVEHIDALFAKLDHAPGDSLDEQLSSLRICLDKLPEHQRNVLRLHYSQELDCSHIAKQTGRSREAVKKLLQRSRAWLGNCIEQRLSAFQEVYEERSAAKHSRHSKAQQLGGRP